MITIMGRSSACTSRTLTIMHGRGQSEIMGCILESILDVMARGSRTNPNGLKRGFECPEERDYCPYWRGSPWVDVAVFTKDVTRCEATIAAESQNAKSRFECQGEYGIGESPIQESKCASPGGTWVEIPARNLEEPACISMPQSVNGGLFHYDWTLPDWMDGSCVLRVRHNVSAPGFENLDADQNDISCPEEACADLGRLFSTEGVKLPFSSISLELDASQQSFPCAIQQDRSYVFKVAERPSEIPPTACILNINYRRRGNSVQSFPALTYSFVPRHLVVQRDDYLHIQFHGSNLNRAVTFLQGWQHSDRTNLVQAEFRGSYVPRNPATSVVASFFPDNIAKQLAEVGMDPSKCESLDPTDIAGQQNIRNCAVLNAAPPRISIAPF